MTEWRPVVGYEANYRVSSDGQVKSLPRNTTRGGFLRAAIGKQGYPEVSLWLAGRSRTFKIHQLVAAAFLGPRPEGLVVRHLNGNPADNRLSNLCYGTPEENGLDSVAHGTNRNAAKTRCPAGHEYDESNTYSPPSRPRQRYCRTCNADRLSLRTGATL